MNKAWKMVATILSPYSKINSACIIGSTCVATLVGATSPIGFERPPIYDTPVGDAEIISSTPQNIEDAAACVGTKLSIGKDKVSIERPMPYLLFGSLITSAVVAYISVNTDEEIILDAVATEKGFYAPGKQTESRVFVSATQSHRHGSDVGIVHAVRYKDGTHHAETSFMHGVPIDTPLGNTPLPHTEIDPFTDISSTKPNEPLLDIAEKCLLIRHQL